MTPVSLPATVIEGLRSRVSHSVFWLVWSQAALQIASLASTVLVARLLHPEDYGIMAVVVAITGMVGIVTELGLGAAIIQFRELDDRELNVCFWLTLTLSCVAYLVLYCAADVVGPWFNGGDVASVLRVAGLTLILSGLRVVPDGLLRKRLEFGKLSIGNLLSTAAGIPCVATLAILGGGVWALVVNALVISAVQCAIIWVYAHWRPGMPRKSERIGDILRYSFATLGSRVCWAIYQQADVLILGKVAGSLALGAYSIALQIALVPAERIAGIVNQLAAPAMAELQAHTDALRRSVLRTVSLVAWVTIPIFFTAFVVAEDFVRIVLSDKWLAVAPLLAVLVFHAQARSLTILFAPVLSATYRTPFLLKYNITMMILMPLSFWIAAVGWSAWGVAVTWAVVYPLIASRLVGEALRQVESSWGSLWSQLYPPLTTGIIIVGVTALVRVGLVSVGTNLFLRFFLVLATAVVIYIAGLLLLAGKARSDVWMVLGWLFRRGIRHQVEAV